MVVMRVNPVELHLLMSVAVVHAVTLHLLASGISPQTWLPYKVYLQTDFTIANLKMRWKKKRNFCVICICSYCRSISKFVICSVFVYLSIRLCASDDLYITIKTHLGSVRIFVFQRSLLFSYLIQKCSINHNICK